MKNYDNITIQNGINLALAGAYRVQVFDAKTQEIVSDYGWHKNLILNVGMDAVASNALADLMHYGVAGTGSRPNNITSSIQAITQSGNWIGLADYSYLTSFTQSWNDLYGTRSYTSTVQAGDLIIDQDFTQSTVVLVSGSYLYVTGSDTNTYVTPKTFTIWKTSQTRLQGEISRSAVYFQGSSSLVGWNCGTVFSSSLTNFSTSIAVHRRTWDFTVENQSRSYTEIGTSWDGTRFNSCFSRVLLPQSVSVSPNQQLRLTYDLMTIFGPFSPQYSTASIAGWPVAPSTTTIGTQSLQSFMTSYVSTNGSTATWGAYGNVYPLDPGAPCGGIGCYTIANCSVWVSEDTSFLNTSSVILIPGQSNAVSRTMIPALDSGTEWSPGTIAPYINGTYAQYKYGTLGIYQGVSNNIRCMGFGGTANVNCYGLTPNVYGGGQCMLFIFDQPQTKTNLQTLTLQWKWSWSRVIQ